LLHCSNLNIANRNCIFRVYALLLAQDNTLHASVVCLSFNNTLASGAERRHNIQETR